MLIYQHRIYRKDLQANPHVLYVFGDNEVREGLGGQALEMRGEPNAIGVATLHAPSFFWTDKTYARNCKSIDADMAPLFTALAQGRTVVFPLDGIGTGLARLQENAPLTWEYLCAKIIQLQKGQS